uniref:Decapping nuclease n=1 Tax=Panagrellus redivivus TaxID=6233 RepID=A0A7E4ZSL7_PANRE
MADNLERLCTLRGFNKTNSTPVSPLEREFLDDFALDRQRNVTLGRDNHQYLVEKYLDPRERFAFDLSEGYETFDPKPEGEGINSILKYILLRAKDGDDLKTAVNGADIVCWRGLITKLATSFYEQGGVGWKVVVTKLGDTLFMSEVSTEAKIKSMAAETAYQKKCTYWGHKFETFIFAKKDQNPTPNEPVSTWEEKGVFFTVKLPGKADEPPIKLLCGAEIDGLDSDGNLVEVKTQVRDLFVGRFFPQKAMKWWIQSTLVGIQDIVVGFKLDSGIVNRLTKVQLNWLRNRLSKHWDPNVCLRTAGYIFNAIKTAYNEKIKPGQVLIVERQPDSLNIWFTIAPAESQEPILTEEFIARFGGGTEAGKVSSDDGPSEPKRTRF